MAELKTKPNELIVKKFLDRLEDKQRREDCYTVLEIMQEVTQAEPKMWGASIVGFGDYHYKYDSGHEGDTFIVGFSPRKQNLTLYLTGGLVQQEELLKQLGKYKAGKGCLYINKLEDVKVEVLKEMVAKAIETINIGNI